ncbi:MAG: hypothetical protein JSW71_23130, partial [Gemmatimonadota bacterium]
VDPWLLAYGYFDVPDTPGVYVFHVENVLATTLDQVNDPPSPSPTSMRIVTFQSSSFDFVSCIGDINHDGLVEHADLGILLAAWDTCEGDEYYNPDADLDGDDCVLHSDLGILLGYWGTNCLE